MNKTDYLLRQMYTRLYGADYLMITKLEPKGLYSNRWEVIGSTGNKYTVSQKDSDASWACSCRGWTSHVPRKECKHIKQVLMKEPVDMSRTAPQAAENFKRFPGVVKADEPVFLLQTTRRITFE